MVKCSISGGIGGGYAVGIPGMTSHRRLFPANDAGDDSGNGGATATATAAPGEGNPGEGNPGADPGYSGLLDAVTQRAKEVVEPIGRKVEELSSRLNQAANEPAGSPVNRVFGGRSPQATAGGTWGKLEAQGYRFSHAYGLAQSNRNAPGGYGKLEDDVHQKLTEFYCERHGFSLGGVNSILMPFGTAEICDLEQDFGAELRQMVAQGVSGADPGHVRQMARQSMQTQGLGGGQINQALSAYDDTAMGVFTSTGMGEMIDLVRAKEVFSRLGASQITLPPNGYLPFPRQTGASQAFWVGENSEIGKSEPTTGQIEMRARKLASIVVYPNELIRFSTPSVEAFIRMDIARSMALKADASMLEGEGSTVRPRGLISYGGLINHTAGTVGANGDTLAPTDPSLMLAKIEENNFDLEGDNFTWLMRSLMFANIRNRRVDAVSPGDGAGQWLFETNRGDHTNRAQKVLDGYPVLTSSQVSHTRSKGTSSDLTYVLGGIWSNWIIGNHGVMEFATATQAGDDFDHDRGRIRAIRHMDAIPRYEGAFVLADTIESSAS